MYNNCKNGIIPESLKINKAAVDEIIDRLKADPKFCQEFFYGTSKQKCYISQLRFSELCYLAQNYNVVISEDFFSTILYQALWSEGTWSKLDAYNHRNSFFAWLKVVARNAVLERLAKDRIIPSIRTRTPGNTRLALLSKSVEMCQLVIDEQLKGSKYHDFMVSIYVSRLAKEQIMEKYGMTEQEYQHAKYEGEYALKDALLRSTSGYEEEVLRNKTCDYQSESLEFGADMEEWIRTKMGENSLADVFGLNLTDEEVHEKVIDLLYSLSVKMEWNERDRFLWRQRFIHNTSPVRLATTFGRTRAWVDTRFSQLNDRIEPTLKRWWTAYAA